MTKRIFRAIIIAASAVLAACFAIIMGVLYSYFTAVSETQMKTQTATIAHAVENEGGGFFDSLATGGYRVTWIAADGAVIYDTQSDASAMENHSDREEFIEAAATGSGESLRYSSTLTQRMIYCAKRLADGSVIRVAGSQSTVLALAGGMAWPLLIVLIAAVILSAALASQISKRIVKPLNNLNLETPLENDTYEELTPLLKRIENQHRQISGQMEQLRRRQQEWDVVVGSMNEGIVLLNKDNVILSINASAARLLSAEAGCVGRGFLTVCRRLDIQRLLENASKGEKSELSFELNGREYQANASPIMSDGETKGTALLLFDVTDKARAQQMRREFTANVSHELKTPLHTISGSSEIMKNGLVAPDDMPRFIERIYVEAQRMTALIDDIIRLSKLDEGVGCDDREPLSLKALARDAIKRLEVHAGAKSLTLEVSGGEGEISGVAPLVAELVYNLCDNAIKYNRENGRVDVRIGDTPGETTLTVSDTGIGIPDNARDRVFERFYRVDKSHSKEIGGTGLGLSIVKHVAHIHGARIELRSKLGEGTSVTVGFPK